MFIVRVVGRSALRRRAMCSLTWRQPYCSLETQMDIALLTEGGCCGRSFYKHCPPNGGRGNGMARLQTSMNRVQEISSLVVTFVSPH